MIYQYQYLTIHHVWSKIYKEMEYTNPKTKYCLEMIHFNAMACKTMNYVTISMCVYIYITNDLCEIEHSNQSSLYPSNYYNK